MGFIEDAEALNQQKEKMKRETQEKVNEELKKYANKDEKNVVARGLQEEIFKRAIDNVRMSEAERIKIYKNNFEDKDEVIDILLYALAKTSQDELFYTENIKKLANHKPIYRK